MFALIALPIAMYSLLVVLSRRMLRRAASPDDLLAGLVVGGLLLCAFVALLTEALSLFSWIRPPIVIGGWALGVVGLTFLVMRSRPGEPQIVRERAPWWHAFKRVSTWLWIATIAIALLVLVIALVSAPNTHDGLGYHLPRQVRWMQVGAVHHYATDDMRELSFPPLAEYLQMHTMLLTSGDVFVHLPQWGAYVLSALGVALICRSLGCERAGALAALLTICQPVSFLQAASPKNDPLLVFLAVAAAWLMLHACVSRRCGAVQASLIGAALGLAAMTKNTAPIVLFPVCVLFGVLVLRDHRLGGIWRGALVGAVAIVFVACPAARNIGSFGHPLGPLKQADGGYSLGTERHTPEAIASNLVRNLALHAVVETREEGTAVERAIRDIHDALGWDADDPGTTWQGRYTVHVSLNNEGRAPAPVHVVLFVLSLVPLIWLTVRRDRAGPWGLILWACVALGFLLFVALVKWNPWHARLHAPLFALGTVPIAIAVHAWPRGWIRLGGAVIVCAPVMGMLAWVAYENVDRPLHGPRSVLADPRSEQTRWRSPLRQQRGEAIEPRLAELQPGPVAVLGQGTDYNIMRMLDRSLPGWSATHVSAGLGWSPFSSKDWKPPGIIVTVFHVFPVLRFEDAYFQRVGEAGWLNVYVARDGPAQRGLGGSLPDLGRYDALPGTGQATQYGRMVANHAGRNSVFGLSIQGGFERTIDGDSQPRTLLLSVNPMKRPGVIVRVTLDGQPLLESERLEPFVYHDFEVDVPGVDREATLAMELIDIRTGEPTGEVTIGWMQLPLASVVAEYDAKAIAIDDPR